MNHLPASRTLCPHADCPTQPPLRIHVEVAAATGSALLIRYRLLVDLSRIRLPVGAAGGRADGLWRHTCFEAFVAGEDFPHYREFNFSPDGCWQAYAFAAYRDGGAMAVNAPPTIVQVARADGLELEARLPGALLPASRRLRLGLSAVIEDADGLLSYWALRHAPGKPDFHHPDTFALDFHLPLPSA